MKYITSIISFCIFLILASPVYSLARDSDEELSTDFNEILDDEEYRTLYFTFDLSAGIGIQNTTESVSNHLTFSKSYDTSKGPFFLNWIELSIGGYFKLPGNIFLLAKGRLISAHIAALLPSVSVISGIYTKSIKVYLGVGYTTIISTEGIHNQNGEGFLATAGFEVNFIDFEYMSMFVFLEANVSVVDFDKLPGYSILTSAQVGLRFYV